MFFLPGLDSSQPLLPRHCGHSWLLHPMAITNLVLSLSPISNSTLRPWTAAVEALEICLPESIQVLSCYQLSQLYTAPVHLHTSSFPSKSLSPNSPTQRTSPPTLMRLPCFNCSIHTHLPFRLPCLQREYFSQIQEETPLNFQFRLLLSPCLFNHLSLL